MKPSETLERHRVTIRRIVETNRGLNPRVFGSVLHQTDTETSDLDLLIDTAPHCTLFDLARMALEIEKLANTRVDIRTPDDLSPKYRLQVVAEARPL